MLVEKKYQDKCMALALAFLLAQLAPLFQAPASWAAAESETWAGQETKSSAKPLSALAQMPVKELTVFKDGHAFLLHQGKMPTDSEGNVLMDYLPAPVLGTFWPFSNAKEAKLACVVAGKRKVLVPRSALYVREFIEANPGAQVEVLEERNAGSQHASNVSYEAQIIGIPCRSSQEIEKTLPPGSGEQLPKYGDCVLLKTSQGVATVPLVNIKYITFKGEYKASLAGEEFRNLLSLKLAWDKEPGKSADVGMMYLQKGLRWIPEYRVNIDGEGNARVKLQATLVNDLCDLNDVTMHLVVGVPSFSFKDNLDPISLQETMVNVARRVGGEYRNSFSNAIMSQTQYDDEGAAPAAESAQQPSVAGTEKNEDLFVFTVKHVSLRKGQRMVLPVYESELKYKDVYTLTLPFSPPPEIVQHFNHNQQSEIERLMRMPKFMHKIRLQNKGENPLTTAPALLLKNDKVIAQGMMTYTAAGASSDLALTSAIDLKIKKEDKETKRTPNAASWQGDQYGRIDLNGKISVRNYGAEAADLEIVRYVLGKIGTADHEGKCEMVNIFEDYDFLPDGGAGNPVFPPWWNWYSWPNWWSRFNGVGKITWHEKLKEKEALELNYNWSYYWR